MTFLQLYTFIKDGMRLPVVIYKNKQPFLFEENFSSASLLIKGDYSLSTLNNDKSITLKSQFVYNCYYENFILININNDYVLLVGPMTMEYIRRGSILSLIDKKLISAKKLSIMEDYYNSILVLNDKQYYSCGKLIEHLLSTTELVFQPSEHDEDNTVNKEEEESVQYISHSPYFLEQEIRKLVSNGDTKGVRNILSRINTYKRATLASNQIRSLKNSLICDCTFMARAAIQGGVHPEKAFATSDRFIRNIEEPHNIRSLETLEQQMMIEFTSMVKENNVSRYSQVIRRTLDYIIENMKKPLNLTIIADALFINSSYLSGLFSKEIGTPIMKYILKSRVDASKWELCYTDNSVANIALIYQFSSQSYYIHCFKRVTELTPLQYRKKHLVI